MENKHIIEKNLKTINGQSILGEGDIEILQNLDVNVSTLTPEQLDYLRDKQIKYGMWTIVAPINNFIATPEITKLPVFNTKVIGNLTADSKDVFILKKDKLYKIEVSICINGSNSNYLIFGLYNDNTGKVITKPVLTQPPTATQHLLFESFISEYIRVEVDTPMSLRIITNNYTSTPYTMSVLNNGTKINIAEISSFDVSLKNFKINGKSFDENNNIDLEGLSTLSSPIINQEVLTEFRHPVSGKPIYTKTIDFGALPNNTTKSIPHNLSNVEWISIDEDSSYIIIGSNPIEVRAALNPNPLGLSSSWSTYATVNNISILTGADRTSWSGIITVQYTKTTDTAESPVRLVGNKGTTLYEIYLDTVPEGKTPLTQTEWLETMIGGKQVPHHFLEKTSTVSYSGTSNPIYNINLNSIVTGDNTMSAPNGFIIPYDGIYNISADFASNPGNTSQVSISEIGFTILVNNSARKVLVAGLSGDDGGYNKGANWTTTLSLKKGDIITARINSYGITPATNKLNVPAGSFKMSMYYINSVMQTNQGGGFKYTESDTEPDNPSLGDEWHNTTNDILYKRRKKNGILGWYEI